MAGISPARSMPSPSGCSKAGDSAVVFGAGLIGLMAIEALKAAGAASIHAVEMSAVRRAKAEALGAVGHDPAQGDVVAAIHDATGGGVDFAYEVTGVPAVLSQCVAALADCADDAASLLDEMTATGLAPDWAEVTAAGWRPTAGRSSDNGYEAMRVPLFLIWSGDAGRPAVARQAEAQTRAAASEEGAAVVFARESGMVMERSLHPGYAALAGLTVCARSRAVGAAIPPFDPAQPYFPATLHLMALVAQIERAPRCFPL